jgi:PAS domain S-box-containing protein
MSQPLQVLFIEDSASDAELIQAVLTREGFAVHHERVQTAATVKEALTRRPWDIIICDYVMPELTAPEAIRVVRERDAEIPLIVVSGTVGEEQAVEAIQLGANDYLLKDRLAGLGMAVRRALTQHKDRIERDKVALALSRSEARYHTLFDYAPYGIVIADRQSRYLDANATVCRMLGYAREELIGMDAAQIVVPTEIPHIEIALKQITSSPAGHQREWRFRRKDGSTFAAEVIAAEMPDGNLLGMIRDISERRQTEEAIQAQLSELQRWHAMTLGREEHIITLKREINELLARQGQPPRYTSPDASL